MGKRKTTVHLTPMVGVELNRRKRNKQIISISDYMDKLAFDGLFKNILVMKETRERFISLKEEMDEDTLLNKMIDIYEREA